jgi:hypothetical protein
MHITNSISRVHLKNVIVSQLFNKIPCLLIRPTCSMVFENESNVLQVIFFILVLSSGGMENKY